MNKMPPKTTYKVGRVHCKFCGKEFDRTKELFVQIPTGKAMRYAHPDCYKKAVQEKKIKDEYTVTDPKKIAMCRMCLKPVTIGSADCRQDLESYFHEDCWGKYEKTVKEPKDKLYNYLMSLCGWEDVPPKTKVIIDRLVSNEQLTYDNIRGVLKYWYEIKGEPIFKESPVGIVPYALEEAKAFYQQRKLLSEKNDRILKTLQNQKINYLTIKKPKIEIRKSAEFSFLDEEEQT